VIAPFPTTVSRSTAVATKTATAEKTATPKAEKPKSDVQFTEDGRRLTLRNPQVLILEALKKAGGKMTRKALAEKCPGVGFTEHLGATKPDAPKNKFTVSLLEQKFVKASTSEDEGLSYEITAAGRKALEKSAK
jgi:hypothetical protein